MTTTPKSTQEDILGESWVELSSLTPDRVTPLPFGSFQNGEMQRLLWEAQRESNQSSARVSGASTQRGSPRSPPNSPNTEPANGEDLKDIYINYTKFLPLQEDLLSLERNSDWVWDWSSRPDQQPPKQWKLVHPRKSGFSMRNSKAMKCKWLSVDLLSIMVFTNFFSLLIGAGLGYFMGKRFCAITPIPLD